MNDKKENCCNTDSSDCNTQETNCCTTEKVSISNIKKKAGLGILLLAVIFAVISAFGPKNTSEKSNCSSSETSCETSCETGSEESSCCSKK